MYVACDLSGIQRYVLAIKSAGRAQAKRLRARSLLVELFERAALVTVKDRLHVADDDVLSSGGGGFLMRVSPDTDLAALEAILVELQRLLWEETGGEVHVSLRHGADPMDARAQLEYRKRRPAYSILQHEKGWCTSGTNALSREPLGTPCDVCGRAPGRKRIEHEDENALYCEGCLEARRLGEKIVMWNRMRRVPEDGEVSALGVEFGSAKDDTRDAFRVRRWIPRNGHAPLTFEEIANQATGDKRLAVLKADVDDMGWRLGDIAKADPSYGKLKAFSGSLHSFFIEDLWRMLSEDWQSIYTIYAGGDDLLLVGPWNVILDFAGEFNARFEEGPGAEYDLTMSAGIAFTPHRTPIRHAVEQAEKLLVSAKGQEGKGRCATLDTIWKWGYHGRVIGDGKKLVDWVDEGAMSRSLLQRLLTLAKSGDPTRGARWSYQVQRNVRQDHNDEIQLWADEQITRLQDGGMGINKVAASLKYALLATRDRESEKDQEEEHSDEHEGRIQESRVRRT